MDGDYYGIIHRTNVRTCRRFFTPQINSLEDTGLSPLWLQDLILKSYIFAVI